MKYLVPMARAKRYDCERLAEEIARHQFSTHEVGVLYAAWRMASPSYENASLRIRSCSCVPGARSRKKNLRACAPGKSCSATWTSSERLRGVPRGNGVKPPRTMDDAERENAWLCLQQAIADLTRLSDKIEKENGYVESESADSDPGASSQGRGQAPDCTGAQSLAYGSQEGDPLGNRACRRPSSAPEKAEPYRQEILDLYASCQGNLVRVHEELLAAGASLSYPALTAFCRRQGIGQKPIAAGRAIPLRTGAGDAARHLAPQGQDGRPAAARADRFGGPVLLAHAVFSVLPDIPTLRLQGVSD